MVTFVDFDWVSSAINERMSLISKSSVTLALVWCSDKLSPNCAFEYGAVIFEDGRL